MWGAQKRSKTRLKNTPCKNAFKKHPLQNRTNVQIKGGGVKGLLNNVKKIALFWNDGFPYWIKRNARQYCVATLDCEDGCRGGNFPSKSNQFGATTSLLQGLVVRCAAVSAQGDPQLQRWLSRRKFPFSHLPSKVYQEQGKEMCQSRDPSTGF